MRDNNTGHINIDLLVVMAVSLFIRSLISLPEISHYNDNEYNISKYIELILTGSILFLLIIRKLIGRKSRDLSGVILILCGLFFCLLITQILYYPHLL